jgi:hypothetical protein
VESEAVYHMPDRKQKETGREGRLGITLKDIFPMTYFFN